MPLLMSSINRRSFETGTIPKFSVMSPHHPHHPHIPYEIVYYIFSLAAVSSRQTARALCLVSSWAHRLVIPYLLRTTSLKSLTAIRSFQYFIANHPWDSLADNRHAGRSLWLSNQRYHNDSKALTSVLSSFKNLNNIATTYTVLFHSLNANLSKALLYNPSNETHYLQLTIRDDDTHFTWMDLTDFAKWDGGGIPLHTSLFNFVTHLQMITPDQLFFPYHKKLFPRLTHLALSSPPKPKRMKESVEDILKYCVYDSGLQMVVQMVSTQPLPENLKGFKEARDRDSRFHVAQWDPTNLEQTWLWEAEGGETLWEKAVVDTELFMSDCLF